MEVKSDNKQRYIPSSSAGELFNSELERKISVMGNNSSYSEVYGFGSLCNLLKTAHKIVLCLDMYFSEVRKGPQLSTDFQKGT